MRGEGFGEASLLVRGQRDADKRRGEAVMAVVQRPWWTGDESETLQRDLCTPHVSAQLPLQDVGRSAQSSINSSLLLNYWTSSRRGDASTAKCSKSLVSIVLNVLNSNLFYVTWSSAEAGRRHLTPLSDHVFVISWLCLVFFLSRHLTKFSPQNHGPITSPESNSNLLPSCLFSANHATPRPPPFASGPSYPVIGLKLG